MTSRVLFLGEMAGAAAKTPADGHFTVMGSTYKIVSSFVKAFL
jgi:hypothetical protein